MAERRANFEQLHKRHVQAILVDAPIFAPEILRQIHTLLAEHQVDILSSTYYPFASNGVVIAYHAQLSDVSEFWNIYPGRRDGVLVDDGIVATAWGPGAAREYESAQQLVLCNALGHR